MGIKDKIKPKRGFSYLFHLVLTVLLPALLYTLIRIDFFQLAVVAIILSKWRMFAVKPRHWPANVRANAVDITVGISLLIFMGQTDGASWQLTWAGVYGAWLIFIKPLSSLLGVSLQAILGQTLGLMAIFLALGDISLAGLAFAVWAVSYGSVRHFLSSFDEPLTRTIAYFWAYFAGALTWILGHWLLYFGPLSQITLLLTILGFGLGTLYYLHESDRLSSAVRREIILVMVAIIAVIVAFSDWGDKAV